MQGLFVEPPSAAECSRFTVRNLGWLRASAKRLYTKMRRRRQRLVHRDYEESRCQLNRPASNGVPRRQPKPQPRKRKRPSQAAASKRSRGGPPASKKKKRNRGKT